MSKTFTCLLLILSFGVLLHPNLSYGQACTLNAGNNITTCQDESLSLTATATGSPTVVWTSVPAGFVQSGSGTFTPTIDTSTPGTYIFTVTGNNGDCTDDVSVTIIGPPVINVSPNVLCGGSAVQFSTIQESGFTYSWDYGDGSNTQNGVNVQHTYNQITGGGANNYTVEVTATNNNLGCSLSSTQTISVGQLPDASIWDYTSPDGPFNNCGSGSFDLFIDNESSTIATNLLYEIDWGDGSSVFSQATLPLFGTTPHSYSNQGYFDLVLTVTGQNGCSSTESYEVYNGSNPSVGLFTPGNSTERCLPFDITFDIIAGVNNPPGTVYTITTNDGSSPITYTHPPPAEYVHSFVDHSCGASGAIVPNAYYVTIEAETPCGVSYGTVEPITTAIPPEADFEISPDTIACINTTLNFTNTTIGGVWVDGVGVCDTTAKLNWLISPNSGWVVQSGALGSSSPNNNPNSWGSNSLDVSFSEEGVYSISLVVGRDIIPEACGRDTVTKYVCIQAPPVPDFIATPLTGCAPLVVDFTDASSPPPICGEEERNWAVSQTSSTCVADSTNNFVFISGTNAASLNPVIRFNNQGIYEVTLSITNVCGTFTTDPTEITLIRKPEVSITVPSSICLGETISPTSVVQDCGDPSISYNWTFSGGTPATSTLANPTSISYSSGGSETVSLTVQNSCGEETASANIFINTPAAADAGADQSVCINSGNVQLNGIPGGGSWSGSTYISSSGVFTSSEVGVYELIYTVGSGNCLGYDTTLITVDPLPNVTVTPSAEVCMGQDMELIASGADTYVWSPSTALSAAIGTTVTANPTSTTTYTVIGTNSTTGCEASADVTVTINPLPIVDAGPDQTLCNQPISIQLADFSPIGGTWGGDGVTPAGEFTPFATGGFPVTYTYTDNNGCIDSSTVVMTVINPTDADAGDDQTVCMNSPNIQLNGLPTSGTWSGDPLVSSSGLFTPSHPGTFNLTYTYGGGSCLSTDEVLITVDPL
ncbi:PKD domain-containing protein, partial [Flavobacteriales bacterium]|nr:PKD domain-containing protein [Flavobacteriales bacterium]